MTDTQAHPIPKPWEPFRPTALLVLDDGTILEGDGAGATGETTGELCFNTAMTGYQEIMTDPSYSGQIIAFTFPHIGNVGVNDEDLESIDLNRNGSRGVVLRAPITKPSNFRAQSDLDAWLKQRGIVALVGLDTRALTVRIRNQGMCNALLVHDPEGRFDREALKARAAAFQPMEGMDLAKEAATTQNLRWSQTTWRLGEGYGDLRQSRYKVVAVDFGAKRNILRLLADAGCDVRVVPAQTSADEILAMKPDGVFLSNGPGDPAATARYAGPMIAKILDAKIPTFGICLGHQILALAIGGKTVKMHQGHHGANHPVMDYTTGKVEIVSMNHGFAVDPESLPANAEETHRSLFDGSNCGLRLTDRPAFSVQHHPEASPGPQDSHYLFSRFIAMMEEAKAANGRHSL